MRLRLVEGEQQVNLLRCEQSAIGIAFGANTQRLIQMRIDTDLVTYLSHVILPE